MRRALPFVLLLAVALGSAAGAVTGISLGERVSLTEYRAALLPYVAEVDDALAALEPVRYADVYSRDDVLLSGGGATELRDASTHIGALHVPRTVREEGRALRQAAARLATTVSTLTAGARGRRGEALKVREDAALTAAFDDLAVGARTWHQKAKAVFGSERAAETLDGRKGTTAAAFIITADDTCVRAMQPVFVAHDQGAAQQLEALAQSYERALPLLVSQVPTGALRARTDRLRRELSAAADLPAALRLLARGRTTGAEAAVEAAVARLDYGIPHVSKAAGVYRDLGARWCSALLGQFDDVQRA